MVEVFIIVPIVVVAAVILVFVSRAVTKRNQTRCPKCKVPYNVDGTVDWQVVSTTSKEKGFYYDVEFRCKCKRCGNERSFQHSFRTDHTNADGDRVDEPLETVIRRYFNF